MSQVILDMSLSLDGFVAGPKDEDSGLHNYFFSPSAETAAIIEEGFAITGAIIMGRRTYDVGAQADGFVDNPYQVPTFVLSHTVPQRLSKGAEDFVFVTDGIESALAQARAAARDRAVVIGGGADVAQQFLNAGLVDELHLHLIPRLLGAGIRLFDQISAEPVALESTGMVCAPDATHLKFRVVR